MKILFVLFVLGLVADDPAPEPEMPFEYYCGPNLCAIKKDVLRDLMQQQHKVTRPCTLDT